MARDSTQRRTTLAQPQRDAPEVDIMGPETWPAGRFKLTDEQVAEDYAELLEELKRKNDENPRATALET